MEKILAFLGQNRGSVGNLFFLAVAVAFQPWLLASANASISNYEQNLPFAFLMFTLIAADLIGIYYKTPAIAARNKTDLSQKDPSGVFTILWIGRLILSTFFFLFGVQALGVNPNQEGLPQTLFGLGMMLIVIKELVVLGYCSYSFSPSAQAPSAQKELLADLCQWFYISFSFILIWEGVTAKATFDISNLGIALVNIFAATLLFSLIFLPLRAVYIVEDYLEIKTETQAIFWWISILSIYISSIGSLLL